MLPRTSLVGRRQFLAAAAALSCAGVRTLRAEDPPAVRDPRATSGDTAFEPNWDERLTITVGQDEGDLRGDSHRVLQAAVDYIARLGGGTVQILPGEYRLRNAVFLPSGVRLLGSGADSVLVKEASVSSPLAADSDWYDQEITLADATGFEIGDGVCLRAKNPHDGGPTVIKRTLVARSGNRFKLDRALRENIWLMGEPTASTLFPLVTSELTTDLAIENLVLDGNREHSDYLDGNHAGCIWLQDCSRIAIRGVEARNSNGDGISWQICHDVLVEGCHSHDNASLGLHPGSGSQRPIIRDNRLERNEIGIFFCWGVKYGLAERNRIVESGSYGVSIGHRDTDNLICDNEIIGSGKVGVLFRPERGPDFAPHRNTVVRNRIVDSGPEDGVAVDVQGQVTDVEIADNDLEETRSAAQRVGVRVGAETQRIAVTGNRIAGFAQDVERMRDA